MIIPESTKSQIVLKIPKVITELNDLSNKLSSERNLFAKKEFSDFQYYFLKSYIISLNGNNLLIDQSGDITEVRK